MAKLSHCAAALAVLTAGTEGARISRKRGIDAGIPRSKFIAGVPVLNYHTVRSATDSSSSSPSQLQQQKSQFEAEQERRATSRSCCGVPVPRAWSGTWSLITRCR